MLVTTEQIWQNSVQYFGGVTMSVASEYVRAEQVVADVALLQDMAAGRLDEQRVVQAAQVLLEHRRHELPSMSVAVAARLLGVSRTTVESWRQAGVLASAAVKRRRHEVTIDSLVRLQALVGELRRPGKNRELRDYVWWSAQDTADYADGKLAEALRQLRAGEVGEEYVPSGDEPGWARRELGDPDPGQRS
ncbi:MAG TPA: helix-turn-helix domain-containing protein [Streptosporangiaceae bacterium]|nr:helix-turn-helix domain-containing protein [Streptosporangiaceae bacterium]